MKLTIISSSQRTDSESARTAQYIAGLAQQYFQSGVQNFDLSEIQLPLFDGTIGDNIATQNIWSTLSANLAESDAVIFVTPEWNGSASPALKNMCFYLGTELAHKPVMIVSVTSSATNGAYPVTELRMTSYKNTHICYIPDHVIVRSVGECFHDAVPIPNSSDAKIRERIDWTLSILQQYASALSTVRNSGIDFARYPYGM
jgi:NAD(P)H-dependent FMN reductase